VIVLVAVLVAGCAMRRELTFSSTPESALVTLHDVRVFSERRQVVGTTPCRATIRRSRNAAFIVASLPGYETELRLLPKQKRADIRFEMSEDLGDRIREEIGSYSDAYVARAEEALLSCHAILTATPDAARKLARELRLRLVELRSLGTGKGTAVEGALGLLASGCERVAVAREDRVALFVELRMAFHVEGLAGRAVLALGTPQ
jgi:hypothetical protein